MDGERRTVTADSYFTRLDEHRFTPSEATGGAWNTAEQHISPMNGLIVHEVERFCAQRESDGMAIGRISTDILGVLGMEPFELTVEVIRPGRTIELLEAVVVSAGRPAVRARVWRSTAQDTARIAGGEGEPLPSPDRLAPSRLDDVWPGGFIDSIEVRPIGLVEPGRAAAWVRSKASLVEGEAASDLARLMGLVDTANGMCVRESVDQWLFPNLDLALHLFRQPEGGWLGLDTTVVFGPAAHGVTMSALHDRKGHFGQCLQHLTIRPRG